MYKYTKFLFQVHNMPWHGISNNVVCATCKASDQPAQYARSDQSLCYSLEYSMIVKLLTEHHLEFLTLNGDCTGLSESTLDKIPHCWKSLILSFDRCFSLEYPYFCQFYYRNDRERNGTFSEICETLW